jgi:hypothetical protein
LRLAQVLLLLRRTKTPFTDKSGIPDQSFYRLRILFEYRAGDITQGFIFHLLSLENQGVVTPPFSLRFAAPGREVEIERFISGK